MDLQTGKSPDDWVEANVAPVLDNGDRHSLANYRPIFLTCVCANYSNTSFVSKLCPIFSKNKLLTPVQHGLRSKHSCDSKLLITTDEFIQNFAGKTQTNFLTNKTQQLVVDGSCSKSARVKSGMTKGTALGLLKASHILAYINGLPSTVPSFALLQMIASCITRLKCRADQEQLQRHLFALQDWADRWGMCFNPSKCSVLRVSRPKYKNLEFQYTNKVETLANVS